MIVNGNLEVIVTKDDFSNLNDGKDFIIANNADYAILEDKKRKRFKYKVAFDYLISSLDNSEDKTSPSNSDLYKLSTVKLFHTFKL